MKPYVRSILYIVIGYAGLVAMLLFLENSLVYRPYTAAQGWITSPNGEIQDVHLTSADGTHIHAWFCPCPQSTETLLFCHGNAGNLSHRGDGIVKLRDKLNVSVLIFDYPGYGKSDGVPSEQGCYLSADAAYDWLTGAKKYEPHRIIFLGESLGGGVAADLASRKGHRALVLVKTFTSLPDAAAEIYWWLPVPKRLLMRNRFDSVNKIAACKRPVFIAHGTSDEVVPYAHGQRLYAGASEPKEFLSMQGEGHNDPLPDDFFASLAEFLKKHPVE